MSIPNHILIIGSVWPEPNSSAAGSRMMQLLSVFKLNGWKITFASVAADSQYMVDLNECGVEKVNIELNNSSFDAFVSNLKPSVVMFDRFMTEEQFGWRIAEQCPDALRILDTEDLHCLRLARQKALKENRSFSPEDLMSDVAKREVASILRCDISLIISAFEMELLQKQFKVDKALLYHLPFMLEPVNVDDTDKWIPFESRKNFITIGNFLHEPNWNAVLCLKEEIWPAIHKQLPEAESHVYGAYPSKKVFDLNDAQQKFFIKGRAESAAAVMSEARVCLAPLRFGAGLKGKLTEAMTSGTPSVTTGIGAEAMYGDLNWGGLIANTAKDIAAAAVELYNNKSLWQQSQQNGINIINNIYPKNKLSDALLQHIIGVQGGLKAHRSANFTGAMLMHHTINSTKYMARWIEAKNKV